MRRPRFRARRWLLVGSLAACLAGCAPATAQDANPSPTTSPTAARSPAPPGPTTGASTPTAVVKPVRPITQPVPIGGATPIVPPPSAPVAVDLPTLAVHSGLERLGLDGDGRLQPPVDYGSAGWYEAGVQPGQPGPAVIGGHRDTVSGPAVFARLGELSNGDPVVVTREDGSTLTFTVTGRVEVAKDAFPTASVYGPVPAPEVRLITCGGDFDRSTGHYRDNVVVFARLA